MICNARETCDFAGMGIRKFVKYSKCKSTEMEKEQILPMFIHKNVAHQTLI